MTNRDFATHRLTDAGLQSSTSSGTVPVGPLSVPVGPAAWGTSILVHAGVLASLSLISVGSRIDAPAEIRLHHGRQAVRVTLVEEHPPSMFPEGEHGHPIPPEHRAQPFPDLKQPQSAHNEPRTSVRANSRNAATTEPRAKRLADASRLWPKIELAHAKWASSRVPPPPDAHRKVEADSPVEVAEHQPDNDASETEHDADPQESMPTDQQVGVLTGAEILDLPQPDYPLMSRRLGEEGSVLLRVEVLSSGRAGAIEVLRDPGFPRLVRAATEAARTAQYKPASRRGQPVADHVRIPFRFALHE